MAQYTTDAYPQRHKPQFFLKTIRYPSYGFSYFLTEYRVPYKVKQPKKAYSINQMSV